MGNMSSSTWICTLFLVFLLALNRFEVMVEWPSFIYAINPRRKHNFYIVSIYMNFCINTFKIIVVIIYILGLVNFIGQMLPEMAFLMEPAAYNFEPKIISSGILVFKSNLGLALLGISSGLYIVIVVILAIRVNFNIYVATDIEIQPT